MVRRAVRGDLDPENVCFCKNLQLYSLDAWRFGYKFGYKLTPFSDGIKSADSILNIKILVWYSFSAPKSCTFISWISPLEAAKFYRSILT